MVGAIFGIALAVNHIKICKDVYPPEPDFAQPSTEERNTVPSTSQ
jgi:hypothetical protein